jgi:hypothetical protein
MHGPIQSRETVPLSYTEFYSACQYTDIRLDLMNTVYDSDTVVHLPLP